jgi:short subunit dehydrogenase-like uncharacterized protein
LDLPVASPRDYDVVLYGAGGFTGRQTVAYFATHAPAGLRWAIAGPRLHTLEAARRDGGGAPASEDVLIANSNDQRAVDAVVARTRVLLSTAGPFALYGTPVVDACVRFGTDYVDITGETAWVHDVITRYHDRAASDGTRIIPCCGFDSIPSDLGALLIARHLREVLGVPCAEVRGYFRLKGGLNGGTVASLLNMIKSPRRKGLNDPFLLDPPGSHSARQATLSAPLERPRYDPDAAFWTAPFVMAPTNTRVVRRSAALYAQRGQPYGPDFVYTESSKYTGPFASVKAVAGTTALASFVTLLRQPLTRRLLETVLPKPGTGPSTKVMDEGWFTCELLGIAEGGKQARGMISYQGDPGNRATVTFLCESALALVLQRDTLPGGLDWGGVLTPATGLGPVLVDRLRRAGVTIDVGH